MSPRGRAEDLAERCVQAARGSVERLKVAVPQVAAREHVPVDALANYMAFRLSLQGHNWWGQRPTSKWPAQTPGTLRETSCSSRRILHASMRWIVLLCCGHALRGRCEAMAAEQGTTGTLKPLKLRVPVQTVEMDCTAFNRPEKWLRYSSKVAAGRVGRS